MSDLTRILDRVEQSDAQAAQELLPLVYDESGRTNGLLARRTAPGGVGHNFDPNSGGPLLGNAH